MAGNAQEQLSKELGPEFEDVDVRDLNPKAFIQKHLLDDVEPIVADVKKEITDVHHRRADRGGGRDGGHGGRQGVGADERASAQRRRSTEPRWPRVLTPFDPDAT